MILYLDTSALVKLYVREAGSGEVKKLARESAALATSIVAYAEVRAAFARLMREGVTVEKRHRERLKQF
ncbi:MAG: type II toxin-antitoxin system VapC family toxin, partial [Pseudomonadota bacterium]